MKATLCAPGFYRVEVVFTVNARSADDAKDIVDSALLDTNLIGKAIVAIDQQWNEGSV